MKILTRGFITEKQYGCREYNISRYWVNVDIFHDIDKHGAQAAITATIPLTVFTDSEGDKMLEEAMTSRKVLNLTVEFEDK